MKRPLDGSFLLSVTFIIGEGYNYEDALDNLMKNLEARMEAEKGYNPQALFPVDIRDTGNQYIAIQQWKWYTDIVIDNNENKT